MLRVRLQRVGRRNDPSFRIVVTEKTRGPKSGKYIEMLGSYNPRQKHVSVKGDRIKYWLSKGAQASDTVHNILVGQKILEGKKINALPKKHPIVKEKETEEAQQEAAGSDNSNKEIPSTENNDKAPDDSVSKEKKDEGKSEVSNEPETDSISAEAASSDQPDPQTAEKESAKEKEKSG